MGKGEIACYEQFLLFPHCFKRLALQTRKNQGLFGKGIKMIQMAKFALDKKVNIGGKEENAGYQHFPLFLKCFQKAFSVGLEKIWILW